MAPAPFVAQGVALRRARPGWSRRFARVALAMVLGPPVIGLVQAIYAAAGGHPRDWLSSAWLLSWVVGAPLAALASAFASLRRREGTVDVEAGATGVSLAKRGSRPHVIPQTAIQSVLSLDDGGPGVEIALTDGDVLELRLASPDARRTFTEALGFGALERRAVIALGWPNEPLAIGCVSVAFGGLVTMIVTNTIVNSIERFHSLEGSLGYIACFAFVSASLLTARYFNPGRIVVGADGLVLEKGFRKRFIPLASLIEVRASASGVVAEFHQGEARSEIRLTSEIGARGAALIRRIRDAIDARGLVDAGSIALVARGGRSLAEWREGLRSLVTGSAGYRAETTPLDVLLGAAGSGEVPAEQRLGAAMAIGLAGDAEAKARLRVAVESIANDRFRVAMIAAVDGELDEAGLEKAVKAEVAR